jgi:hypothetical protein
MKRCPANHTPAANATMTIALAHCIFHSSGLVTKDYQIEIFAADAAWGLTSHHDSRPGDNRQGQDGKHDANQFQSASVCHLSNREKSPAGIPTRAFPPSSIRLVNSTNQLITDAADNDHGWSSPRLLSDCPHRINAALLPLVPAQNPHGMLLHRNPSQ